MIWCDIIYQIRSDQIRSYIKYHTSHITSRHVASRHVTSGLVWSLLVSSRLVSFHIISYYIITYHIMFHYNTRSTRKSPVRQQNAWLDTKKPGWTQKCPVRHKNALPSMHQLTLPLSNIPPPVRNIFSNFIPILRTNREMKMKLYWYEFKISVFNITLWKLKCNHSFLFVMAITSAAINKCYRYGRIFCQFLHFLLIAPLKSDTHVRRA